MQPRSPKLREDIRDAAAFIREVAKGKSLADYGADRLLRQAIEGNFEIIAAARRSSDWHSAMPKPRPASATTARSSPSATS